MRWINKWDKHNQSVAESSDRLYQIVTAPDSSRYEVEASDAFAAAAGAPSVLLYLPLMVWALFRKVRGAEWEVVVRPAAGSRQPIFSQNASTHAQAISVVAELALILSSKGVDAMTDR